MFNGFKVLMEFQHFGWLKFIFQHIYYFFVILLVTLTIVFAQKAGELWFNNKIPWGAIFIGLTWGLFHAFTQGNLLVGLYGCLLGFLFGTVYLLEKKNIYVAYWLILLMFIL